jgi:hypothetical protein
VAKVLRTVAGASALLLVLPSAGRAGDEWQACVAAPTRTCTLALLASETATVSETRDRINALSRLAVAEASAEMAVAADRDFAAAEAIIVAESGVGADVRRAQYADLVAAALVEAGRTDAALALTAKIEMQYPATALGNIAARQVKEGRNADAAATASLAAERSRAVTLPIMKFDAFRAAAQAERAAGRTEDANAAEADAAAAVQFGADGPMRDRERGLIAKDQLARGDVAAALKTLAGCETPQWRDWTTLSLARAETSAGRLDAAAQLVETLSATTRFTGLAGLATAQKRYGANARSTAAAAEIRQIAAAAQGEERIRRLVDLGALDAVSGDEAAAAADFAQARAQSESLPNERRAAFAKQLAYGLLAAGRSSEAMALLDAFDAPVAHDAFLRAVAQRQIEAGAYADALQTIHSLSQRDARLFGLEKLATALPR